MSDDKSVTGPDDDETFGHGGVEVPADDEQTIPRAQTNEDDDDDMEGDIPETIMPS
jgi:hypothetical protein